ncbi:MAG: AAA family ATPase [Armatimonadetes bacterium]|nr:AAA family ATPase [Armatimonadota bacterium]
MRVTDVEVAGFRSLGSVTAKLEDYTTLLGRNDSGKSSFLRALQLLFDPAESPVDSDYCRVDNYDGDCYVGATLTGYPPDADLAPDGSVRIRRHLHPTSRWEYWGRVPAHNTLKVMKAGTLLRMAYTNDHTLDKPVRNLVETVIAGTPGKVAPETWKQVYASLVAAELVDMEDGWCALDGAVIGGLVEVVMLQADARAGEELKGPRSVLERVGGMLVRAAIAGEASWVKAQETLRQEIARIAGRNAKGEYCIAQLNELEAAFRDEIKSFDSAVSVDSHLVPPDVPNLAFRYQVGVSDEWVNGVEKMGHGMQRSVVFAMLRTHRRIRRVPVTEAVEAAIPPLYLFLMEEPELYLHPQAERSVRGQLQGLSLHPDAQVVLCTHSAAFVDLNCYKGIVRFERPDRRLTLLHSWTGDDLPADEKNTLNTTYWFDPNRAAMLFADRVILVEGATEKVTVPHLAERLGLPTDGVEMVDCGGNGNIPLFQRVLEEFKVPYVAWLDSKEKHEVERARAARSQELGRIVLTNRNWEHMTGLRAGGDKTFRSWQHFVQQGNDPNTPTEQCICVAYARKDFEPPKDDDKHQQRGRRRA